MKATVYALVDELHQICELKNITISTAESCTGGLVSSNITEKSGVSSWFLGGVVSYANQCKQNILKVSAENLDTFGAVSEPVALQMAQGANRVTGSDFSVALTGIAGPEGGSIDKPVGTVWIAWAKHNQAKAECFLFEGDRNAVREQAVMQALKGLIKIIKK
ncbi:CinA family protein [Marinicellulosiphila megalodicopiae]|uniref:CinA family protein n=1 Tax=Marinicellulosiphila megalodicopiae TaxID=2724896 RepID=UPI003BAF5F8F